MHRKIGRSRPDITFAKHGAAVFLHGCFWHGHAGCRLSRTPKSNVEFWTDKIAKNAFRDARNVLELEAAGFRVAVVWECAIRDLGAAAVADAVSTWLREGRGNFELGSPRTLSPE